MNKHLSCCYFPTTVVLVDDDEQFLKGLGLKLPEGLSYKPYSDGKEAIHYLNKEYRPDPFTRRFEIADDESLSDHLAIDVDMRLIRNEIYRANRFSEISVLVVDYAMPGLNGVDFCRQLNNPYVQTMMLTGEADQNLAVKAFNEGIINKFIIKSDQDLVQTVKGIISELQEQYFNKLSSNILDRLFELDMIRNLYDPTFINYFKTICEKNNIIEYYLTDSDGGFLLLDENAKPSWLAVKDSQAMQKFYDIAHSAGAPEAILSALSEHKKVPYFFSDEDLDTPPTEWGPYLHPAKTLTGELETYCIAHITDPDAYELDRSKILPYQQYLDEHE